MAKGIEVQNYNPGDIIFHEGERTFCFYMIKEGDVEVFKSDRYGQEKVLAHVREGQCLGEIALIDRKPRSASARAVTPVVAVCIAEGAYKSMMEELPTWAQAMFENMVERLRMANQLIMGQTAVTEQAKEDYISSEHAHSSEKVIQIEDDLAKIPSVAPEGLFGKTG